jgi:hypothetical protein
LKTKRVRVWQRLRSGFWRSNLGSHVPDSRTLGRRAGDAAHQRKKRFADRHKADRHKKDSPPAALKVGERILTAGYCWSCDCYYGYYGYCCCDYRVVLVLLRPTAWLHYPSV